MNEYINYIVSGLERSGTSMLMQILEAGGVPIEYDKTRKADENNPRGYYELYDGKIITKLKREEGPFEDFKGKFIKITAYGLQYLPDREYKIIFSTRNIKEIVESGFKMHPSDQRTELMEEVLLKLLNKTKKELKENEKIKVLYVNYNRMLNSPDVELKRIKKFLKDFDTEKAKEVIDQDLYRTKNVKNKEED